MTSPFPAGEAHQLDVVRLANFTDDELRQELRRRQTSRKPSPAFRCENCGAVGYYVGHFKPNWFEVQHAQFHDKHKHCRPYFGGGGI